MLYSHTIKLVKFYSYIDGLKTGYTGDAGYCLTSTGKKNGMRLITVVMGEPNTDNRTKDTIAMMDYGFGMYSLKTIIKENEQLGEIKINLGDEEYADIVSTKDITALNNNQDEEKDITYNIVKNKINAPVKKGDVVGKINVYEKNNYKYSVDITINKDINKASIFKIFIRNIKNTLSSNIN